MAPTPRIVATLPAVQKKIWIDLENSPRVPFFVSVIEDLKAKGYEILPTARDSCQGVD
jgi:predicted glycosyltransferase